MFEKNYKNQMDSIKADNYIKDKIRRNLRSEKTFAPRRKKAYFGTTVAAVLCGAILFSSGIVLGRKTAPEKVVFTGDTVMKTVKDYNDLYDTVKTFLPSTWDKLKGYAEGLMDGGLKNGNASEEYSMYVEEAIPESGTGATTATDDASVSGDYSETNVQVEGVDEADIVKTDGKYIYILSSYKNGIIVKIVDISGKEPKQLSSITELKMFDCDMYLSEDRLVILGTAQYEQKVMAAIYDISNPEKPKKVEEIAQSGYLNTSRLIGGRLYVISNYTVVASNTSRAQPETFVPSVECKDYDGAVEADTVFIYDNCQNLEYTVVTAYGIENGSLLSTQSLLGGSYTVYANTDNIITAGFPNNNETQIARFMLDGDQIKLVNTGKLEGQLLNQFSIDEYKGYFRFVLTSYNYKVAEYKNSNSETYSDDIAINTNDTVNSLVILDSHLNKTGEITNIAPNEKVYSVRFMGDTAYFVTFRQVDPLFSVDVSNPKEPKIIGALKIPGFSDYLFPFGNGKLLGLGRNADEQTGSVGSMKLSMFDISNPANVTESDKTDVPANYSDALANHKAAFIDYNKNIIGFSGYGSRGLEYYIYSYEKGKFVQKLSIELNIMGGETCRGLYSNEVLYIATAESLHYYNLKSFEKIGELKLD